MAQDTAFSSTPKLSLQQQILALSWIDRIVLRIEDGPDDDVRADALSLVYLAQWKIASEEASA
jgi:hypothetical protein